MELAWKIGESKFTTFAICLSFVLMVYSGFSDRPLSLIVSSFVLALLGLLKIAVITYDDDATE